MTVPTDLRRCTGWYTCETAGYDIDNNRLIDKSGLNFHMPLAFGSPPSFITRAGVNCIDLDNSFYFEIINPVPLMGSIVFKFHTDAAGSPSGTLAIMCWSASKFANNDHAAVGPNVGPWETYDVRQLFWLSPSAQIRATSFIGSDPGVSTAAISRDVWHVVTVAWNQHDMGVKARVNSGATLSDIMGPPEPNAGMQCHEDLMRFGYLKTTGGLTSPQHLSVAEMAFFHDDILVNQSALAAALVTSWS